MAESGSRSNVTGGGQQPHYSSVDIPSEIAAEFIGRGHAQINAIMEATGVRITPINEPDSDTMTLIMVGFPDQIDHAVMRISIRAEMLIRRQMRRRDRGCPDMLQGNPCSRGRLCPYDHRPFRMWE